MSETRTRKAIDAQIAGAGWVLPPVIHHTVEVEGDFRDQKIKKALGGKRPDYHFYESADSKAPIGLLEAKREGGDLDYALEQAKEKSRLINQACRRKVCTVLLASDGRITKSCNHEGVPLTINDVLVDSIPTLGAMLMLKETPSLIDGEQIETSQALVELFEDASKELRRAGIGAGVPSLLEFSRLLFIKIMSEQSGRLGGSARAQWREIVSSEGKQLINAYRSAIRHWKDTYGALFQRSILDDAGVVAQIVLRMNAINFKKSHVDVKGSAYEWFLSKHAAGAESGFGQNFTPRHITRAMATILEPNPGDVIYDPFSGTGGMLLACYEEIGRCIGPEDTADRKQKWRNLRKNTLFGNEIDKSVAALAQMNMIIIGDGHANIRAESSLISPDKHWCNLLITNIPFNMKKPTGKIQAHYRRMLPKKAIDSNEACLLHCMESLVVDGKFAIIIPETILYGTRYKAIREYLADNFRIRGVVRLPRIVFRPYTTAKTAVLVGDRAWSGRTTSFPVIEVKKDGLSEDPYRRPIPENDIPDVVEAFVSKNFERFPKTVDGTSEKWVIADAPRPLAGIKCVALGDLLNVRGEPEDLDPSKSYNEPEVNTTTHEISTRTIRRGSTIRIKKIIAKPGDLIIGTLHTNNNNGNFAFADKEYIIASQIAATVKEEIVSKDYLAAALEAILPKLPKDDLVGRETFSKQEILDLQIPIPREGELKQIGGELDVEAGKLRKQMKRTDDIRTELIASIRRRLRGGLDI